jgi:hypothetical protein
MKEDTKQILKDFIQSELEIENVQFHNVHRLKPRRDRKPPSIVAKFVYNKDKDAVLKAARTKLVHKPFKIYQQYPQEISERRRVLVPTMKELRDQNRRAYIVKDKLYVDVGDFTYPQKLKYKIIPHFVMIRMPIVMLILETKFALAWTRGIVMLIKNTLY